MRRRPLVIATLVVLAALGSGAWRWYPRPAPPAGVDPAYASAIQPIFDRRCVPCHACFDSPCQLNLGSFEGLDRGANKSIVYFPERLDTATPTRLFQDAKTTLEWQTKLDFFPVVDRRDADPERSILWRFVEQRINVGGGSGFGVMPTTCPQTIEEAERDLASSPSHGMPFGLPGLTPPQSEAIATWLRGGAGGPRATVGAPAAVAGAIRDWEGFLNQDGAQARLVAAYVFEHLFYAHLYFDVAPGAWFRLVRSKGTAADPLDEIATRRPYDDPGPRFTYRLRPIRETIVEKTHVPYELSATKLGHIRQLFSGDWSPGNVNPYDPKVAANPFVAFAAIPARARYQFMLDDARYHVQTFIHGPVCRGEAALDVIDEHFLIFFLDPDSDPSVTDPSFLSRTAPQLAVPAVDVGTVKVVADAIADPYARIEKDYLGKALPAVRARSLADVWHGDGTNPHGVLTVYRHYDSAFVLDGALGGIPKTAWVMDYPIFERMYYDLVAGFDVYGNVFHQVSTRLYQNLLRIESEGQFLRFLPTGSPSVRKEVHDSWYRGRIARAFAEIHAASFAGPNPDITYADPSHAKEELITRLLTKELPAAVVGPREPIQWPDVPVSNDLARARFERHARVLVDVPAASAPYVYAFPDVSLLHFHERAGEDLVFTIVRNRSHTSVEFIPESAELQPDEDTLHIVPGIATSRPGAFFSVEEADLDGFMDAWSRVIGTATGEATPSWTAFVVRYGARRTDPTFWDTYDFFEGAFPKLDPIGAGVLDLSRYVTE